MSCEYCDGSKKPIKTEVEHGGHLTIVPTGTGFQLDACKKFAEDDVLVVFSFAIPCCPMCGRRLGGDGE